MVIPLDRAFFDRPVREVAPDLVGCTLLRGGVGGVIVEVERYEERDAASHSHRGPVGRAAVMFGDPGRVYVYRSYGLHWCANLVCDAPGTGAAVLLRALRPTAGMGMMRARRGDRPDRQLCSGPGRLAEALGIDGALDGGWAVPAPDGSQDLVVLPRTQEARVARGPRIGITKDAHRPWRYALEGSAWLSRPMAAVTA